MYLGLLKKVEFLDYSFYVKKNKELYVPYISLLIIRCFAATIENNAYKTRRPTLNIKAPQMSRTQRMQDATNVSQ